jgi:hypothetical protein
MFQLTKSFQPMALGLTHPLRERSTRIFSEVKGSQLISLTTSLPSVILLSKKCESLDILQPYRPDDLFTFLPSFVSFMLAPWQNNETQNHSIN